MFETPHEIQELMERLGVKSQKDFARMLGITPGTMSRLLKGKHRPSARTLKRLIELADEAGRPLAVGVAAIAEERLGHLYGRLQPEQVELIEKVLADPKGRAYILQQARFWLSQREKREA